MSGAVSGAVSGAASPVPALASLWGRYGSLPGVIFRASGCKRVNNRRRELKASGGSMPELVIVLVLPWNNVWESATSILELLICFFYYGKNAPIKIAVRARARAAVLKPDSHRTMICWENFLWKSCPPIEL